MSIDCFKPNYISIDIEFIGTVLVPMQLFLNKSP